MIKKIILLAILAGGAYVGYLVWNNLDEKEKGTVSRKAGQVVDGAKDLASKAADKLTGVAKDEIKKIDDKDAKSGEGAKGDDKKEAQKPEAEDKKAEEAK